VGGSSILTNIRCLTLSEDGDPIDVLVANTRPIFPGAVINVRPIGVLKMEDNAGGDEKIVAVPSDKLTQRYVHVQTFCDLPTLPGSRSSISFCIKKTWSRAKWVKLSGWGDASEAKQFILQAIGRFERLGHT